MLEDDFADIIKKARHGLGLKLEQAAEMASLPPAVLRELESGRQPQRDEILAIAAPLGLDGSKLASLACDGWAPVEPSGADKILTIHGDIGGYAVKGYLLYDPTTRDAVLIDTGYNPGAVLQQVERERLRLTAVCLTHGHVDHAGGLDDILSRWPVPVYMGQQDWNLLSWQPPVSACRFIKDGEQLPVGGSTVTFMTTPGHTPGGVCYRATDAVFVGDTLFAGSIGRANPASLYPVHLKSVRERLLTLPDPLALFPGHGPATTVAEEKAHNPFA
jgi:hydroxyacylglutathione hydrolase